MKFLRAYLKLVEGDPGTPGVPAYENATRSKGENIPRIPSIPISWDNAKRILAEIDPDAPFELNGVPSKRRIRLLNQVKSAITPIWNTMGVIPGHIKNEVIILGNHRDGMSAIFSSSSSSNSNERCIAWVIDPPSRTPPVHALIMNVPGQRRR
jgi:hypothetical protein